MDASEENDSSEPTMLEELGLVQAEERLQKDCIFRLTKVCSSSVDLLLY